MRKTQNNLIILGSGTSTGNPMIGCKCAVCTSTNPKDVRLRSSIYITTQNGKKILIDVTPDFRYQFLKNKLNDIDFVLITHEHADHIHGIDDLRQICFLKDNHELDLYSSKYHSPFLISKFDYIFNREKKFKNKPILGGGIPLINLKEIDVNDKIVKKEIGGEVFSLFMLPHNYTHTMCFYHNGLCYIPDCKEIPDNIINFLANKKIELLIINCLQKDNHETHLTVNKCFNYILRIGPKQAGLIHMNHHLSHTELTKLAKETFDFPVFPVYDGLNLNY